MSYYYYYYYYLFSSTIKIKVVNHPGIERGSRYLRKSCHWFSYVPLAKYTLLNV